MSTVLFYWFQNDQSHARQELSEHLIREQNIVLIILLIMVLLLIYNLFKLRNLNVARTSALLEVLKKNEEIVIKNQIIEKQKFEQEKINLVKDKLFSVISHDMRAPLMQLKGILNLMEMKSLDAEEWVELVPELKKSVQLSSEQLDNLLLWSKNQMQGFNPVLAGFNLYTLVEKSKYLLEDAIKSKDIQLLNLIKPGTLAQGDREMIKIVVRNLLSNAIKFTPSGGSVRISSELADDGYVVRVKDTGVGVDPENAERIFTELDFTTRGTADEKGTGLGLKLAKDFITMNGGRIWVTPAPEGVGSIFSFTLRPPH